MRLSATASALVLLLVACGSAPKPADTPPSRVAPAADATLDETARLNAWFERKYEEQLQFSPIGLSFLGRKDRNDQLDDFSDAGADAVLAWQAASVSEMEAGFAYDKLSDEARTSYDVWKYQYEMARRGAAFRRRGYVFEQMNGVQSFLPTFLISFHQVDTEADMRAYLARVRAVRRLLDQGIVSAQLSLDQGVRPPRFAYQGVIEQSQKVITGAPFDAGPDSALWADMQQEIAKLQQAGTLSPEAAAALTADARSALMEDFLPAYQRLIAWVRADLPNALENPTGVSSLPGGDLYYAHQLAQNTTTRMGAEEIHQLGLAEVARLRAEMEAVKASTGFTGSLEAFFEFLDSDDPRFRYPNTDAGRQAYIDEATKDINNIKRVLPQYFGLLPKADLIVKRVEPFREQDGAAQHYFSGTPDGARPGIYYAHLSDMSAMPRTDLEVTAYHEGLPGHHMQISIAQELTDIPTFRTQAGFTAYAEGWGLYAEWLAKQMPGTYQDPYSEFGRLGSEMWRAIRLVVDTGLHAKGWTEQQAVDYCTANSDAPLTMARSEVQRYLVTPGQATAYKVGMIRIQQLRANAEAELGPRFDIKGFHDTVLGGGSLPLDLLERRVDQWVERQRGG